MKIYDMLLYIFAGSPVRPLPVISEWIESQPFFVGEPEKYSSNFVQTKPFTIQESKYSEVTQRHNLPMTVDLNNFEEVCLEYKI